MIELLTYRFRGHSMSDPAKYRAKGELEAFRAHDPLEMTKKALLDEHGYSEDELDEVDDAIFEEMSATETFADESPQPAPEARFDNMYVEEN